MLFSHESGNEQELHRLLDEFEELWQKTSCPDLNEFFQSRKIATQETTLAMNTVLLEVLSIDLERRLRSGFTPVDLPQVAEYVKQFPQLSAAGIVEMAVEESRLRAKLRLPEFPANLILEHLPSLSAEQGQALRKQLISARQEGAAIPVMSYRMGPGDHIGKYLIVRKLGEGGMGVVFEAEQDQSVRRPVAIKIIQSKFVSSDVVNRFNVERQALALMDHEHIARVFDAGVTSDGLPYFVMELVQGLPITEFCDRHKLPLNQRLKLFVQICEAIQHAHQKGIVHRDLKPGNVLVSLKDSGPHVKVIDFGVAKAIEPALRLNAETLQTGFGKLIGTLQYMSPEQAEASADIDARSDVYSLGIILYELLTGTTPVNNEDLQRAALDQVLAAIQKVDPPRPSIRLSSLGEKATAVCDLRQTEIRRLNNELRGDLDWIVMKALEKDRKRRYDSATQFAEDIQRYLLGQAVIARPPSWSYRMQKSVRQHRVSISVILGVLVTLVIAVSVTTWQMFKAQAETNRANAELELRRIAEQKLKHETQVAVEQSRLALDTLTSVIRELQSRLRNLPGAGPIRRRLLIDALERIRKISTRHAGERLVDRGTLQGLLELGEVVLQFGTDPDGTAEEQGRMRESSLAVARGLILQAVEIAVVLRTTATDEAEAARDLAVASLKLGIVEQEAGDIKSAEVHYLEMLNLAELLVEKHLPTLQHRGFLAEALRRLGDLCKHQGDTKKAQEYYDRQLKISAQDAAINGSRHTLREHTVALERAGQLALETDHFDEAIERYQELLKIRRRHWEQNPHGVVERRDLAIGLDLLADALVQKDRIGEAVDACQDALKLFRSLDADNPGPEAQGDLAAGLIAFSHVRRVQIRLTEAEALAKEASSIYARLAEQAMDQTAHQRNHALSLRVISTIQLLRGDWVSAKDSLKQAQAIRRRRFEKTPRDAQAARDFMAGQRDLGQLYLKEHDFSSAKLELQIGFDTLQQLIDARQLVQECRANQAIFQRDLDGCAIGPIAVGEWKQVLEQPPEKLPLILAFRCELLVPERRIAEIAEAARFLLQIKSIEPDVLNDAAAGFAACMKLEAGWNGRESYPPETGFPPFTDEQKSRCAAFGEEALGALRKARDAGFKEMAENWTNPAFAALITNHEFRVLCGRPSKD